MKRCGGRPFDNPDRRIAKGEMRRVEATVSRPPGASAILGPVEGDATGSIESITRSALFIK